ncbi:MAG: signal peptidase I [Streptosporangiales bacterium]|nr:signal peptidase I [Streptosporangiales bacterium]
MADQALAHPSHARHVRAAAAPWGRGGRAADRIGARESRGDVRRRAGRRRRGARPAGPVAAGPTAAALTATPTRVGDPLPDTLLWMSDRRGRARYSRAKEKPEDKKGGLLRELAIMVVLVLGLTALLRGFVVGPYVIPSGSMENTLQVGDKILVNKLSYRFGEVERGDVIVFDGTGSFSPEIRVEEPEHPVARGAEWLRELFGGTPVGEKDFVKRVVGVGGDRVECRRTQAGYAMFVNGTRLKEKSYLFPGDKPCREEFKGKNAVVVPKGRLWVMGDHRSLSADSREHVKESHLGTVPENEVIGRAFVVIWPTDHWRGLSTPGTYERRALRDAPGAGP